MRTSLEALKVLIIDNYDSFTYNLVQYVGEFGCRLHVFRNDGINCADIRRLKPDRILISPGPGRPSDAGISEELIRVFSDTIPILGICLGHQAIGEVFGGRVVHAPELKHGKTSMIHHNSDTVFSSVPDPFEATRYHSLILAADSLPDCLAITAWTDDGLIMGVRHRERDTFGVQFHPESIMTRHGKTILRNFLCCRNSQNV